MFRSRVLAVILAGTAMATMAAPVAAAPTAVTLTDGIAAGVVRGSEGFSQAGIVVPAGTYVTYVVQTEPALAGRVLEIWTRSATSTWQRLTSRSVAADGSVHYFARVTAWTAFQARFAGDDANAAAAAHGRVANASARGDATLVIGCDEFQARTGSAGTAALQRSLAVRAGAVVRVRLCSNASTGYRWDAPVLDGRYLSLLAHRTIAPAGGMLGAAGSEAWTMRALGAGASTATFTYSRPWAGGEKATWTLRLAITVIR